MSLAVAVCLFHAQMTITTTKAPDGSDTISTADYAPEINIFIKLSIFVTLLFPSFITNLIIVGDWQLFSRALISHLALTFSHYYFFGGKAD